MPRYDWECTCGFDHEISTGKAYCEGDTVLLECPVTGVKVEMVKKMNKGTNVVQGCSTPGPKS